MKITKEILKGLQNRLKVGNRRGVHLNSIPGKSKYKFDLKRLAKLDEKLPKEFLDELLSNPKLNFPISWKNLNSDINTLFEDDQAHLVSIKKSLENLVNQTNAIEAEKGIKTFGFGYPILVRRNQSDNNLTVSPVLIWSLNISPTKDLNTWIIRRTAEDPIYINEVLINHLESDSKIKLTSISDEFLEDGLIDKEELITIISDLLLKINLNEAENLKEKLKSKFEKITRIKEKKEYEKLPITPTNSLIEFSGLFSIFQVQKHNIINDYDKLIEQDSLELNLDDFETHSFQSLTSIETDPSQQGILNSISTNRNLIIQGPPGTGKSQSLTAIITNALENNKKIIVVCEKRTALEVIQENLKELGLENLNILIKDIIRDRRTTVDIVRNVVGGINYNRYRYVSSKDDLNRIIEKAKEIIKRINNSHKKIDQEIFDNNNWSAVVGKYLFNLRTITKNTNSDYDENFWKDEFSNLDFDFDDFHDFIEKIESAEKIYLSIKGDIDTFLKKRLFLNNNFYSLESDLSKIFKEIEYEVFDSKSDINKLIKKYSSDQNHKNEIFDLKKTNSFFYKFSSFFVTRRKNLIDDQNKLQFLLKNFFQVKINPTIEKVLFKNSIEENLEFLKSISNKYKNDYLNSERLLNHYNWYNSLYTLDSKIQKIISKLLNHKGWKNTVSIYFLNKLLEKNANNNLPTNGNNINEAKSQLSELGNHQIEYIRTFWRSKQIDLTREFAQTTNISVENLYNKRSSNRHKRHSLRQIINFDPELFTSFFPVIFTTPDVASNLFLNQKEFFDLVIFDEASQLRIEENFPALLKGKQIIIAGDEHQMPPSNYFSKVFEDGEFNEDEEEEGDMTFDKEGFLLSAESLLEFGMEYGFEKRFLDFHYRSKHPFLIDFSNHAFYNKRLKPMKNVEDYNPIKFFQVDGTYSGQSNESEANFVIEIIDKNINQFPDGEYPSVGVATFNITQRNLILSKINDRKRFEKFNSFNKKIIELEKKGFFVKNLENIQGDERDIIILSTTYGVNDENKFYKRFGQLNFKKGYRLLNVIITRAKYKIYMCTSIPQKEYLNYGQMLEVEGSNNRSAVFYAYIAYCKAVSESNNDLRIAVLNSLSIKDKKDDRQNYGSTNLLESPFESEVYESLVEIYNPKFIKIQEKVAEFRIDLVYHNGDTECPRIAIECDGAKYHSSREAYLYDLYRQKILEDYGYIFHRIWSTNWWRNPKKETEKLVGFINNNAGKKVLGKNESLSDILSHKDIESNILEKKKSISKKQENKKITGSVNKKTVQINSVVKIKYLNNGIKIDIKLDESPNTKFKKEGDLNIVNYKSPLGKSLIGCVQGDTVKVGELDTFVEIMSIR
tara:strand:- start:321 stop:4367 length:4047 start_codon:yes stop_codon:yes gene_type:complete